MKYLRVIFGTIFLRSQATIPDHYCGHKCKGKEVYFYLPWELKTMQNVKFFSKYLSCSSLQDNILIYYIAEIYKKS